MRVNVNRTRPSRVLVIGNGPTAMSAEGEIHVERQLGQLLLDLADAGHQVSFAQPIVPLLQSMNYFGMTLPSGRVEVVQLERASLLRGLLKVVRGVLAADLVHIFFPGKFPRLVARLCRLLAKPYALYLRGQQFSSKHDAALFSGSQFILAVSPHLVPRLPGAVLETTVIRPMIDMTPDDAVEREHAPLGSVSLRALFIGRIEEDKGVPELVEAAALMQRRGVGLELTLVGGGPLHAQISRMAAEEPHLGLSVAGVVGDRRQVMRLLEASDVLVLPTHHEGFPRVLYEAMLKDVVIVTTMVGGIPALMRDDENCLAIPVGAPAAIADALEKLANDYRLRQRLTAAGRSTVLEVLRERPTHLEALQTHLGSYSALGN